MKIRTNRLAIGGRELIWSVLILAGAAVLRLYMLAEVPPGLARDEALNADIVSGIRAGRHALFFREGFGHEPLYHYLGVPFQALLGDNVLSIRLPSLFVGLLLVALGMRWARSWFGVRAGYSLGILLAASWWPIIFSRIGLRPILSVPLALLAIYWWEERPGPAGIVLALAVYSYTAARVLLALPLIIIAYLIVVRPGPGLLGARHEGGQVAPAAKIRASLTVFMVSVLCTAPLAITLWRDPTLQERVSQLSGPMVSLSAGDFRPVALNALKTLGFFSFSGDPLWSYMPAGLPLFDLLSSSLFFVGLLAAFHRAGRDSRAALLLGLFFLALGPSTVTPDAPSAVRLILALPAAFGLVALGLTVCVRLLSGRLAWIRPTPTYRLLLAIVSVVTLFRTVQGGFISWAAAPEVRLKYQSIWLDIAQDWRSNPPAAPVVADAWYEPVKAASLRRDFGQTLPTRWIQGGQALVLPTGGGDLYVPEFAPIDPWLGAMFDILEPDFRSTAFPSFSRVRLVAGPSFPLRQEPILFTDSQGGSGALTLVGETARTESGQLQLVTYWEVQADLPPDLALFLHLEDPDGRIVGQTDGLDAIPDTLLPGDRFAQLHRLTVPPNLAEPGLYLGVYERGNGGRWRPIGDQGDRLPLTNDIPELLRD